MEPHMVGLGESLKVEHYLVIDACDKDNRKITYLIVSFEKNLLFYNLLNP